MPELLTGISLYSGVGGFELGFERAGIKTALQVELFDASHLTDDRVGEPCDSPERRHRNTSCAANADKERRKLTRYGSLLRGVLERHWPEVERVNDVRNVDETTGHIDRQSHIDVVYGGFPCQDLSVAGGRAGLRGQRSGEWFEFHRVVRVVRPPWAVIENVPGLLSSNDGWDFATILYGLAGWLPVPPNRGWKGSGVIRGVDGFYDVAWTILDAQYFGVPQRRRRVFIVAGPRGRGVEQVLSLCESCGGHHSTSGSAGETVAGTLTSRTGVSRDNRDALNGHMIIAPALTAKRGLSGSSGPAGDEARDLIIASPITAPAGHHGHSSPRGDGADNLIANAGVRRLTPLENERLMGWPENWTRWTADDREVSDSHRYHMTGNGVVATITEWIGHRLVAVDAAAD